MTPLTGILAGLWRQRRGAKGSGADTARVHRREGTAGQGRHRCFLAAPAQNPRTACRKVPWLRWYSFFYLRHSGLGGIYTVGIYTKVLIEVFIRIC